MNNFPPNSPELGNDIWLNAALFQRVNSVYEQRDALALDSESYRLLTLTWQRFVHAGATLAPEQQAALRTLNTEAATLQSQFQQRLLGAAKSGGLVVDYRHQLAGLSDEEIASAADAARERGLSDRWLLTLTQYHPAAAAACAARPANAGESLRRRLDPQSAGR
ncbi:dipeptidyl carboxypeptidase Dcp [Klebsiella pneumoniae]|nr:dipeptidyl carboxypeptidase Dcp [Klebsiella pneumoniae]